MKTELPEQSKTPINHKDADISHVSLCANCGVPDHLHNTCCGWENASVIIKEGETLMPAVVTAGEKKQRWLDSQHIG